MVARIYALTIIAGLIASPVIALSSAPPILGGLVLDLTPDTPLSELRVAEAGGRIKGPMQAVSSSFALPEDPNFAAERRASGVWF